MDFKFHWFPNCTTRTRNQRTRPNENVSKKMKLEIYKEWLDCGATSENRKSRRRCCNYFISDTCDEWLRSTEGLFVVQVGGWQPRAVGRYEIITISKVADLHRNDINSSRRWPINERRARRLVGNGRCGNSSGKRNRIQPTTGWSENRMKRGAIGVAQRFWWWCRWGQCC